MKTKSGRQVTEVMLDNWTDAFERGEWPEGKTVVLGRPSLADEEIRLVTFRLPLSKLAAIDEIAASEGETRSEFLRSLVDQRLTKAGSISATL
jgi:hypothetical protein